MNSFPPIIADASMCVKRKPVVLILGSMPSVASLAQQQYYAHPHNAFWWIMAQLLGFADDLSYSERCAHLKQAGVIVWDVLRECERPGSLDSRIVRSSEQANDIESLLVKYPSIEFIGFNGGAAKAIFMRHCAASLGHGRQLNAQQLPSTSPAYASISKLNKLQQWRDALAAYL